ncbi:YolD-like family protein [Anaerobacillus sp. HL2]|nr:YolD-like family protein [Anaerobacillus sp. HL2]
MRTILKDRGNIKWTAMMLPERNNAASVKKRTNDKEKPILDEQQLDELNQTICNAIKAKTALEITYYAERERDFQTVSGVVANFDSTLQHIRITNKENRYLIVAVENIIDIKVSD